MSFVIPANLRSAAMTAVSASALLGLATPAAAQTSSLSTDPVQTQSAGAAQGLQEVVVTAQRREQRLQDVPVAVSVVTGASLERSNIKSVTDLSTRLPDVKVAPGALVDFLNIRGVGSGNNAGFEQSVGTFVDGVYRARSRAVRSALFDVDQVEVLKGPQSIFFGANTVAGALNITTRKPSRNFSYNAQAMGGSDNDYDVEGGVTGPLTDQLSGRIAARASGSSGYEKVGLNGHGPDNHSQQGRISLRYDPTTWFRSDLRFDAGTSRTSNAYPFELINCPAPAPFTLPATNTCANLLAHSSGPIDQTLNGHSDQTPTYANYAFNETAFTNAVDLGAVTVTSITSYFDHTSVDRVNQVPFAYVSAVQPGADGQPLSSVERYNQVAQEVRLQSPAGGKLEYMVGGYYSHAILGYKRIAGFYFSAFGAIPAIAATGTNAQTPFAATTDLFEHDTTYSGFATATLRPVDKLRINLGVRYTDVDKSAHRQQYIGTAQNNNRETFVALPAVTQTAFGKVVGADLFDFPHPQRSDHKLMPSVGVQYDLVERVMAYATYSTGFKAGGYNSNSLALDFGPESVTNYEVGLKGQFLDRRLTLNLDVFRADYTNLQETTLVFVPGASPISLVANAAQSRSQGVEANASLRIDPAVVLTADVAYDDARYINYKNGACTILGTATGCASQDMSGKLRPFAPLFSGNVGANITLPLPEGEVRLDPLVYFTSKYFQSATADPLLSQSGYAKFDMRVGYGPTSRSWEVALIGQNLTDVRTASWRQPVTGATGSIEAFPERGRFLAVQVSIRR